VIGCISKGKQDNFITIGVLVRRERKNVLTENVLASNAAE
jgi:hypothetical protein